MTNGYSSSQGSDYRLVDVKTLPPIQASVSLTPSETKPTPDQALWAAIRNRTRAIGFDRYRDFIQRVVCCNSQATNVQTCGDNIQEDSLGSPSIQNRRNDLDKWPTIHGVDAYKLLRLATEVFLILEAGVVKTQQVGSGINVTLLDEGLYDLKEESRRGFDVKDKAEIVKELEKYFGNTPYLPYLSKIVDALPWKSEELPNCESLLPHRISCPSMLELIWSYWHEEGLLVQTMNAIALRFQNRRASERDPLTHLELDTLRPLHNLLWGYIQDEHNRLTIPRRAYEYDHHYGITLIGKAVPQLRSADSRSRFLAGFHNLLHQAIQFYRADADTTVKADGFPLLNALKEVHLTLAEGMHNQYGDLPWTARVEMLIEQWLLARPEMYEFLRGRHMVPYQEPWMGTVDAMKKLQGWGDVSVSHFHDLAVYGEQLLLSARFGDWSAVNDEENAKNWARYWKPEVQGYVHAYRAVTGVDLSREPVDTTPPGVHLRRQEERRLARV